MTVAPVPSRTNAWIAAVSILFTGFVIVAVNILIYRARIVFSANNPDYVAIEPPTISRAISDPAVGEAFAIWMAVCAPILFIGVGALILACWQDMQRHGGAGSQAADRAILWLSVLVAILQGIAGIGMVLLSHYRFPDHHELHMTGSYLFFFSQAFVVVFGEWLSRRMADVPQDRTLLSHRMAAFRRFYVWIPIILGVSYLALFVLKGVDLGAVNEELYIAYTTAEPLLLTSFLGYILTYHVDLWGAVLRYLRA